MHLGRCKKNCRQIHTTFCIFTKYNTPNFEVQIPPVNMRYLHASYFSFRRCSSRSTLGILRQSKFQNILIIGFRASRRIDKQKCYHCHSEIILAYHLCDILGTLSSKILNKIFGQVSRPTQVSKSNSPISIIIFKNVVRKLVMISLNHSSLRFKVNLKIEFVDFMLFLLSITCLFIYEYKSKFIRPLFFRKMILSFYSTFRNCLGKLTKNDDRGRSAFHILTRHSMLNEL